MRVLSGQAFGCRVMRQELAGLFAMLELTPWSDIHSLVANVSV